MSDEAQATGEPGPSTQPPLPPPNADPEPFEFGIELRMDATVTINGQNWIKPGASTHMNWRVRDGLLPSRKELEVAMEYMQLGVLNPVLSEMIDEIHQRVAQAQINR